MAALDIEAIYRAESGRVLATLIRLLGGFELAEEALHDAFMAAAEQWPKQGIPKNPRAWLVSAGRFKAIDRIRRRVRFDAVIAEMAKDIDQAAEEEPMDEVVVADDELRLIFTCCHPALTADQQVAMALREVCGLTTEQIAAAFLTTPSTLAQRIVRAKNKIRDEHVPYAVPALEELPGRLEAVLHAIYLVYNEGYSAPAKGADLAGEAIRLGRLLVALLPDSEALGLLALMLLNESRRVARSAPDGELVLLPDQDRSLWDRGLIAEGMQLVRRLQRPGPFALQAAIAAVHAEAPASAATDWGRIVALYDALYGMRPTAIIALNRAVAIAERDGAAAGLAIVDELLGRGELKAYHLIHAARADLLRRLNRMDEARDAYATALELARDEQDRRFLMRRLAETSA